MAITGPVEVVTYASAADEESATITVDVGAAAGDTLFVFFSYEFENGGGPSTFQVTDSESNTWHGVYQDNGGTNGRDNVYMTRCYVTNPLTAGVSSITVALRTITGSTLGVYAVQVEKFSGIANADAEVLADPSGGTTSTASPASGSPGTPTSTDVLYVGFVAVFRFTTATFTAAAGWSSFTTVSKACNAGAKVAIYPRYQIVSDGSSKTLSGTLSTSKPEMTGVAGFGAAVVAATTGRDLTLLGVGA